MYVTLACLRQQHFGGRMERGAAGMYALVAQRKCLLPSLSLSVFFYLLLVRIDMRVWKGGDVSSAGRVPGASLQDRVDRTHGRRCVTSTQTASPGLRTEYQTSVQVRTLSNRSLGALSLSEREQGGKRDPKRGGGVSVCGVFRCAPATYGCLAAVVDGLLR